MPSKSCTRGFNVGSSIVATCRRSSCTIASLLCHVWLVVLQGFAALPSVLGGFRYVCSVSWHTRNQIVPKQSGIMVGRAGIVCFIVGWSCGKQTSRGSEQKLIYQQVQFVC